MNKSAVKMAGSIGQAHFNELDKRKPTSFGALIEGNAGSALFSLNSPGRQCIALNTSSLVVSAHNAVKNSPEELITELSKLDTAFNGLETLDAKCTFYNDIRTTINSAAFAALPPVKQAATFMCLTKLSFNGLLRTNSKGEINVPFGQKHKATICDAATIRTAHTAMASITFEQGSYDKVLEVAKADDFVLLHLPPFGGSKKAVDAALVQLAGVFSELDSKVCKVMLVIRESEAARDLFSGLPMDTISARSSISAKASGRGKNNLLVITNYPVPTSLAGA